MKLRQTLGALATAAAFVTGSAMAAPITLTNPDGTFVGFTAFDWSSAGQIGITGYDTLNTTATGNTDPFQLQFQATAVGIMVNGSPLPSTSLPTLNTGYEYTIFATVNETATCGAVGSITCGSAALNVLNGTWAIRYDTAPNANYAAGTGFTDGTLLLSGTFDTSTTVFVGQGSSNPGDTSVAPTFFGNVLTTNTTYVNPALTGTRATSTLQFGNTVDRGWIPPFAFDGALFGPTSNTTFFAQGDANQSFSAVPEPGSLALVGLAMGVMGFVARRRKQA